MYEDQKVSKRIYPDDVTLKISTCSSLQVSVVTEMFLDLSLPVSDEVKQAFVFFLLFFFYSYLSSYLLMSVSVIVPYCGIL